MTAKEAKKLLRGNTAKPKEPLFLSTGSTLVNLACTGHTRRGFMAGKYYLLVGGTNSGKTWLAHNALAEASITPAFDNYDFYYNNPEGGALFDIEKFFGKKLAQRIKEPPGGTSYYVEEFYYSVDDANKLAKKNKRPFIYVLDSMDAVNSLSQSKIFTKQKNAHRKNRKVPASYTDGKAARNSTDMRLLLTPMEQMGSILIVIGQRRASFDPFDPDNRAGGTALSFYATIEIWMDKIKQIKREVKSVNEQLGNISRVRIKRSRVAGKDRIVHIPIYHSIGIDDTGSLIDWLVKREHWKGSKDIDGSVKAPEFGFEGGKDELAQLVEEMDAEKQLRSIVSGVWREIEEECEIKRKRRYA